MIPYRKLPGVPYPKNKSLKKQLKPPALAGGFLQKGREKRQGIGHGPETYDHRIPGKHVPLVKGI